MTISAKIIADSISSAGVRITTMELNYPRFIHAEAKTHRIIILDDEEYELVLKQDVGLMDDNMLSRNASSSRAIPVEKMLEQVRENPALPIHWGRNQPGMQARSEIIHPEMAQAVWIQARDDSLTWADRLRMQECHKQVVNRLLEPFQYIKVIVTATEWDNFFKLRLHEDAQPEMYELAKCMKEAMENSIPKELGKSEWIVNNWHLPYVNVDKEELGLEPDIAIKCSVARCARVSYLNHDNTTPDVQKDIALYDKLLEAGHMSPFEHQATPMKYSKDGDYTYLVQEDYSGPLIWEHGITHMDRNDNLWSGNFKSWIQYRQLLGQTL